MVKDQFRALVSLGKDYLARQVRSLGQDAKTRWYALQRKTRTAILAALGFHVALLIVFAIVTAIPGTRDAPTIIARVVPVERPPDLAMKKISAIKQLKEVRPTSAAASVSRMLRSTSTAKIAMPEAKIDHKTNLMGLGMSDLGDGAGFGAGAGGGGGAMGMSKQPVAFKGRCVPGQRSRLLFQHGGSPKVEPAVMNALRYLKTQQNSDGTWGREYPAAMTGLALLSFLGHCETPSSPEFGETVTRGLLGLIEMGQGYDWHFTTHVGENPQPYEHAIATYALGEAKALLTGRGPEEIPYLGDAFFGGINVIVKGQASDGGWVYGYETYGAGDLSVTGWQIQALKTAQHAGIKVEGLESCMSRAAAFLETRRGPKGGFGYRSPGDRASLTGAGLLGLQFLGGRGARGGGTGFDFFLKSESSFQYDKPSCNLYGWYYFTQAAFNQGGSTWNTWNNAFAKELLGHQAPDGSWPEEGSGLSEQHAKGDAIYFRTCLSTLMLEVYYRYLPVTG